MTNKILYIYGYGSNPETSSTMNALKGVITELGFELVSIRYDQKKPAASKNTKAHSMTTGGVHRNATEAA